MAPGTACRLTPLRHIAPVVRTQHFPRIFLRASWARFITTACLRMKPVSLSMMATTGLVTQMLELEAVPIHLLHLPTLHPCLRALPAAVSVSKVRTYLATTEALSPHLALRRLLLRD